MSGNTFKFNSSRTSIAILQRFSTVNSRQMSFKMSRKTWAFRVFTVSFVFVLQKDMLMFDGGKFNMLSVKDQERGFKMRCALSGFSVPCFFQI